MEFPETTERFVAYFDIMGFKDMIYRSDHAVVAKIMDHVSEAVKEIEKWGALSLKKDARGRRRDFDKGIVMPVLFSDSILFISRSNGIFDARKTAYAASYFLHSMFAFGVPIKGAITYGKFTADFSASKFFGRPLVDAYLLAEEVQFYGVVLHHSFENYLHQKSEILPESILQRGLVPMKGGGQVTHSFIDWRVHNELLDEPQPIEPLLEALYKSVSGSVRRYVDNTKAVYASII